MVRLRRRAALRYIINLLKDKLSLSKRFLLPNPKTAALQAILRSTTHHPSAPPPKKHLTTILSYADGSQNTASSCIKALLKRLSKTRNSFVAFKSLIVVHTIIHEGSPILQRQLISVFSSLAGKRNHLKFSSFLDSSTIEAWDLSFWVRWYAKYLESLLFTSTSKDCQERKPSLSKDESLRERFLQTLLFTSTSSDCEERISSLPNNKLVREIELLVALVEDICRAPEMFNVEARRLICEAMGLVGVDKKSVENKIMVRVNEVRDRADSLLSFDEAVELDCVFERFEICKERVLLLFDTNVNSVGDRLWDLVAELRSVVDLKKKMEESTQVKWIGESAGSGSGKAKVLRIVIESIKLMQVKNKREEVNVLVDC